MVRRKYKKTVLREISDKGGVPGLLFRRGKTREAALLFMDWLRKNNNKASPKELSQFTRDLQAGKIKEGFAYRRAAFYRTLLKRFIDFGFLGIFSHGSKYYGPVWQPLPQRGPGGHNWWNLSYLIARLWNEHFWEE